MTYISAIYRRGHFKSLNIQGKDKKKSMIGEDKEVLLSDHHILLSSLKAFFANEVIPLFHLPH